MMKPVLWAILLAAPLAAQVRIAQHGIEYISVEIKGKPFTQFYIGPETNKPYLHPLRSASGKIVTRGYPMEEIPGEAHDHPHHRGLWFAHGDVNGIDFWGNETRGPKFGRIVLAKIDNLSGGKESGVIDATFGWLDPAGKVLLTETRRMTFRGEPKTRTIDFDITLTAREKAVFGDSKEGTFALRVASALEEPNSGGPAQPATWWTPRDARAKRRSGASAPIGWITMAYWMASRWELQCSTIRRIPGTQPIGTHAVTASLRRTYSVCAISKTTRAKTAASPWRPAKLCASAIAW